MIIKYMGHSFFTFTMENGTVIATDPYGTFCQYPNRSIRADICTISHHHSDHDGLSSIQGAPLVLDQAGAYRTEADIRIKAIPTKHDDQHGALRGSNLFFVLEAEGLRIGHAGDLGHLVTAEQQKQIGPLDLLLLPVGGYYTLDAQTAFNVQKRLSPKVTIPMHYKTAYSKEMPIAEVDGYVALTGLHCTPMPLLRIAKEDVSERESVIVLAVEA
ncbi:MAG: MBL fold metallo-hydrolase [Clostridia bacterium]